MKNRVEWIDYAKGFAILLVVFGHVVLGLMESNRFTSEENRLLLFIVEMVYVFHMPLFFALSGYFFKPIDDTWDFIRLIVKRLISLGIPYVFFSICMFVLKKIGEESVRNKSSILSLLNIYKEPIDHLWFLYILFWITIYTGLLSLFIKSIRKILFINILCYILASIFPSDIYLIQRSIIWAPLFILGAVLKDYHLKEKTSFFSGLSYIVYLVVWTLTNQTARISYSMPNFWGIIFPVSVVFGFSYFGSVDVDTKLFSYFSKIGRISLPIYLMHVPIASVTRIVLFKLGITNLLLHFFIGLIVGWFLSIFLYKLFSKFKVTNFLFYPGKYLKYDALQHKGKGKKDGAF